MNEPFNIFSAIEGMWNWSWGGEILSFIGTNWSVMLLWYAFAYLVSVLIFAQLQRIAPGELDLTLPDRKDGLPIMIAVIVGIPILGILGIPFIIWEIWLSELLTTDIRDLSIKLKEINQHAKGDKGVALSIIDRLRKENSSLHKEANAKDKELKILAKEIETLKDVFGGIGRTRNIKNLKKVATSGLSR